MTAVHSWACSAFKVAARIQKKHSPAFKWDPRNRRGSQPFRKGGHQIRKQLSGCLWFYSAAVPETWLSLLNSFPRLRRPLGTSGQVCPLFHWSAGASQCQSSFCPRVAALGEWRDCSAPRLVAREGGGIMTPVNPTVRTVSWLQQVFSKPELLLPALDRSSKMTTSPTGDSYEDLSFPQSWTFN